MEQSSETVPGANPDGLTVEQHYETLASGGFKALQELRASGAIAAFGAGVNADEGELTGSPFGAASMREFNQEYCRRLADLSLDDPINFFLMANIYSLLDFTAHTDGLLQLCAERGISVVVGGPFASGILAGDPTEGTYLLRGMYMQSKSFRGLKVKSPCFWVLDGMCVPRSRYVYGAAPTEIVERAVAIQVSHPHPTSPSPHSVLTQSSPNPHPVPT